MGNQEESQLNGNVFLSWSGEESKAVAESLRDWLSELLPSVKPWISTRDLDKGTMFQTVISDQLSSSNIGIFCLTPENVHESPWMLFEAGVLSKGIGKNKVLTYLF